MPIRNVLIATVALIAGFLAAQVVSLDRREPAPQPAAAGSAPPVTTEPAAVAPAAPGLDLDGDLEPSELRNIAIFRKSSPSVVFITSIALRRDFFSLDLFQIPQGTGSGFVWDTEGHIVTNFHVIEDGNAFSVTLADQSEYDAVVVGVAEDKDLAVLKIDAPAEDLPPLPVGHSKDLAVGQTVLAVGNPFGLDHSLTVGVVSALGRELKAPNGRRIRDVIQTDAAINPGNSGGPLLDTHGRLVGINSAIYSPSGAFSGIGFAVPVDTVERLVPQLITHGRPIQPGIIGVSLLPDGTAARLRLDGAVIYDVSPRSVAARAGLRGFQVSRTGRYIVGDRIVALDGKPVDSADDLLHGFETAGVGADVDLTVVRDGEKRKVSVRLQEVD